LIVLEGFCSEEEKHLFCLLYVVRMKLTERERETEEKKGTVAA